MADDRVMISVGIVPMLFAFFDGHGGLDREAMRRQVHACTASGANGLAVLGLATEVSKLSLPDRIAILEWTVADNHKLLPLIATIAGATAEAQIEQLQAAASLGYRWAILQPPNAGQASEAQLISLLSRVAERSPIPIAIQNAPEYLGGGLSAAALRELHRRHANVSLVKAEGSATSTQQMVEDLGEEFSVVAGRGGLEMLDNLRAGCSGIIPGAEVIDRLAAIYRKHREGDAGGAEAAYQEILPLIVFLMQSLDSFLCYGKYLATRRLDIEFHQRAPCMTPTPFGKSVIHRHFARLGKYP